MSNQNQKPNQDKSVADLLHDEAQHDDEKHETPGTFVLTLVFLAAFATYYFANWKALADLWQVR